MWIDSSTAYAYLNASVAYGTIEITTDSESFLAYVQAGSHSLFPIPAAVSGNAAFEVAYYTFLVQGTPTDLLGNFSIFATHNANTTWYTIEFPAGPYYFHPMSLYKNGPNERIEPFANGETRIPGKTFDLYYRVRVPESTSSGFDIDRGPTALLPKLDACS